MNQPQGVSMCALAKMQIYTNFQVSILNNNKGKKPAPSPYVFIFVIYYVESL